MNRGKATDFDPEVLALFDGYVHGQMTKRAFLAEVGRYAATVGLSGAAILAALEPNYAWAQQVAPDDPAIVTERATYDSSAGNGAITGLLARPAGAADKLPAVLVIHENRGLNPYIEDVVRRLGKAGYLAFGPDGLSPLGGYPGNDEKGREMQASLDPDKLRQDFFAAQEWLAVHPQGTGKVGAVGFCYGGSICNALAVAYPGLAASVPFYGRAPELAGVTSIKAPLLLHFGGLDERVNATWPDYEAALKSGSKTYTAHVYDGANHGFHNDTTPRYDAAAAELAWQRTLEHFAAHLG